MPLTIEIRFNAESSVHLAATVFLGGSLDTATAPELEQKLKPVLEGMVTDLIFDLAKLQFISSAGLRVFAAARRSLRDRGGQVSFVNMQPQIRKVFEIVAALPGMAVFTNDQELDRYLARRQRGTA